MTEASGGTSAPADIGYCYVLASDMASVMANGLPPSAVVQVQPLTADQARARYGFPPDAEIAEVRIDLKRLRETGAKTSALRSNGLPRPS
jgi:hypothetical protein